MSDCIGDVLIPEDTTSRKIEVEKFKCRGFDLLIKQGRDVIGLTTLQAKQLREALDNFIKE